MPHPNRLVLAAALLLLVVTSSGIVAQQPHAVAPPHVAAPVTMARLRFTAVDKIKNLVTTLRKEDVRVLEDGASQEIVSFERQTGQRLALALMIDTSASQERILPAAKLSAREFIDSTIRPGEDEIAIVSFTDTPTLEQDLTRDIERVREAILRVESSLPPGPRRAVLVVAPVPPGLYIPGSTAIWDALQMTTKDVLERDSVNTRRAIIMLTDGVDSSSKIKMSKAIDLAIAADIAIYSIGIGDEKNYDGIDKSALTKLSEQTGGRAFFPKNRDDLPEVFKQIEQELRTHYIVTYTPPASKKRDDALRKVKIEIVNPELRKQNLRLSYRHGYYAKK